MPPFCRFASMADVRCGGHTDNGPVTGTFSSVIANFVGTSSCLCLLSSSFSRHAGIKPAIRHMVVTVFTSHALSSCDKKITRHKADGDEKSDERVTNWAFGYIRPLAHQCQQRQRLPLGDGSNGSFFILARTLCNSRAEGSQRHGSGLCLQRLEHTLPTGL